MKRFSTTSTAIFAAATRFCATTTTSTQAAATNADSTGVALSEKLSKMKFAAKYREHVHENPESPLYINKDNSSSNKSGASYAFLLRQLATYKGLQGAYSVKQTDIERARRAANMCGLDFPAKQGSQGQPQPPANN